MSARAVSLRALVVEDIARTADLTGHRSAARLLRRPDVAAGDLGAVCHDLRSSSAVGARHAGRALEEIDPGALGAVRVLADYCGLDVLAWIEATAAEQRVVVEAVS